MLKSIGGPSNDGCCVCVYGSLGVLACSKVGKALAWSSNSGVRLLLGTPRKVLNSAWIALHFINIFRCLWVDYTLGCMDFVTILWAYPDFVDYVLILIIVLSYSHPRTVKCSPGLVLDLFFLGSHQNGVYDMIGGWNRSHCLFFFYTQQDVYAILAIAYHNVPGPSGGTCVQRDCDTEGGGPF